MISINSYSSSEPDLPAPPVCSDEVLMMDREDGECKVYQTKNVKGDKNFKQTIVLKKKNKTEISPVIRHLPQSVTSKLFAFIETFHFQ